MNIEDQQKEIVALQKHVNNLIRIQDETLAKLPPEQYAKVKDYHADAHDMLRGMKKGDFKSLEKLVSKYNKN
tara:strand:+ start:18094 stop:18309 length:216 start_codon:yes stop_codon:yes gene_type:complete